MTHKMMIMGPTASRISAATGYTFDFGMVAGKGEGLGDVYIRPGNPTPPIYTFGLVSPFGSLKLRNPLLSMIDTDPSTIGIPDYAWFMSDSWEWMENIDLRSGAYLWRGGYDPRGIGIEGSALRLFPSTSNPMDWGVMKRYDNLGPCPAGVPSLGVIF